MEFNLCYKTYPFSVSLATCKRFTDATGLDLHTVLMDYIHAYSQLSDIGELEKVNAMSKVYSRGIACQVFYALSNREKEIPLAEFEDATYRVSWFRTEVIDDMSEPWPLVMVAVAMDVNNYINQNLHVKKKDI